MLRRHRWPATHQQFSLWRRWERRVRAPGGGRQGHSENSWRLTRWVNGSLHISPWLSLLSAKSAVSTAVLGLTPRRQDACYAFFAFSAIVEIARSLRRNSAAARFSSSPLPTIRICFGFRPADFGFPAPPAPPPYPLNIPNASPTFAS